MFYVLIQEGYRKALYVIELHTGRVLAARPGAARPGFGPARPGPARKKQLNFQARNGPKKIKNKSNIFLAESYEKVTRKSKNFPKITRKIKYGE